MPIIQPTFPELQSVSWPAVFTIIRVFWRSSSPNNNESIIIEIGSHTDSRGTDLYNETLSQNRAQSVVDYLVSKGIDKKRIKAKGYGEKEPIAPNQNPDGTDNPEGRQMNRRTEFRVVGTIEGVSKIIYLR